MLGTLTDTICAPITGLVAAAVAVIRVSGPDAWRTSEEVLAGGASLPAPRLATFCRFRTGDEGILTLFEQGKSFTGDQTAEIAIHGSLASVRSMLDLLIASGARMAQPGEFTYRAFMNGKLSLSEAEGIRATIEAQTESQLRLGNSLRGGQLDAHLTGLEKQILSALATVEAYTDFSEELEEVDRPALARDIRNTAAQVEALMGQELQTRRIQEGYPVAIVGRPNVGKSSLLNAILGADRALVSDHAGTTRDVVDATVELNGLLVRFLDTAGIRDASHEVEAAGIERSRKAISEASLVLHVYDAHEGFTQADAILADSNTSVIRVANKADLGVNSEPGDIVVSAQSGHGLSDLKQKIFDSARVDTDQVPVLPRHSVALHHVCVSLRDAETAVASDIPLDLASVHLRDGLHHLGQITGKQVGSDILDQIFSQFCLGK